MSKPTAPPYAANAQTTALDAADEATATGGGLGRSRNERPQGWSPHGCFNRKTATVHRIDLPCSKAGLSPPPSDVHLKFVVPESGPGWNVVAHAAAGKPYALAPWLGLHPGIDQVMVGPGIAPKMLRARAASIPPIWAMALASAKVHDLHLSPHGQASLFVEASYDQVAAIVQRLEPNVVVAPQARDVRFRPVKTSSQSPISRRQFEALSTAVALGYYDIPHRLDLRQLAARTGISLGSFSELLRRAEGAVVAQYVDAKLLAWPEQPEQEAADPYGPTDALARRWS